MKNFTSNMPMRFAHVLCATTLLAACQPGSTLDGGVFGQPAAKPEPLPAPVTKRPVTKEFKGQKVGNGPIRIALLLPTSAQGGAGVVGKQMANAAKLAVRDFGSNRLQLILKDTKGQSAEAAGAAAQARNEGASLVLGPLFSANVSAASGVTRPANIPMVAFSSDVGRAGNGTYLLSFDPSADVRRTLNYGISLGANRVVALLPNGAYGALAERALRKTYDNANGQIVSVVKYSAETNSMVTAARSVALQIANANAIYIPEGGQVPAVMLNSLKQSGVSLAGKQIMGSGQWVSSDLKSGLVQGAIFAGPDRRNFASFARRYKSTYGSTPSVTSANAYDAVSLVAQLIQKNQGNPFTPQALQTRSGFSGATGLFRFTAKGLSQRGLVVNRVENGAVKIISPAPVSFGVSG